jgi:hypothetical protein
MMPLAARRSRQWGSGRVYWELTRKLQRYTVSLRQHEFEALQRNGEIEEPVSGFFVLKHDIGYHESPGLLFDQTVRGSPQKFIY